MTTLIAPWDVEIDVEIYAEIDIDRAVGVITLALARDPVLRWVYPDPHKYMKHFPAFVRALGGRAFERGTAYVTEGYEGAALWIPPGERPERAALAAISDESVPKDRQPAVFELMVQRARVHPSEPHWYLLLTGVDPSHQREGHEARLLERALDVCDEQGLPAYLEATTVESRTLFACYGFEVVRELRAADCPPMWAMRREPRF